MRYAAEEWLAVLRARVRPVAAGAPLELPFLTTAMPNRNHDTGFLLIDLVVREADGAWLPLLRAWSMKETRRVRARLQSLITVLEGNVGQRQGTSTADTPRTQGRATGVLPSRELFSFRATEATMSSAHSDAVNREFSLRRGSKFTSPIRGIRILYSAC
jgi:hypothetical protein